jgi:hypothetical protein
MRLRERENQPNWPPTANFDLKISYVLLFFKEDNSLSVTSLCKFPGLKPDDTHVNFKHGKQIWKRRILHRGYNYKQESGEKSQIAWDARGLRTSDEEAIEDVNVEEEAAPSSHNNNHDSLKTI